MLPWAIFGIVVICAVGGFNLWQNHSTGWVHLRSGRFAERKTQPVLYWGCQIVVVAMTALGVIWTCLIAFGSG